VLGGFGDSDGLAFGAELNPGLDGLLSLSGGRIHFSIPWLGGLQTSCAMSTLNNSPQIINISLEFREYNRLPSLIWKILLTHRNSEQEGIRGIVHDSLRSRCRSGP
jgi:hypothetical protein